MAVSKNVVYNNSDTPAINKYYESVAVAFRYAKFIILFITILFMMVILSFFRDEVSIENFQYMLKYISSEDNTFITTQKIHYPTSDSKALEIFSGDFVSAGTSGITLYDTNGNTVLDIDTALSQPVFEIGRKYGLCYDLSGHSYVVFNTFSKLSQQELDFPISGAAIDDNGNYAVLTKNKEYRTVINVHNSDFDLISRVYKDKYTMDLDINPKQLVYATAEPLNGKFLTQVNVLRHNSDSEISVVALYDEFPLGVKFLGDSIVVITDSSLSFYNNAIDFEQTAKYSFLTNVPGGFVSSDKYLMLYFAKNTIGSENEVKVYSEDGQFLFTTSVSGKVSSIDINDYCVLIHTSDKLYRIDILDKKVEIVSIDTGAEKAILQSDLSVLVCYKNYAKLVDFSSVDKSYYIDITEGR